MESSTLPELSNRSDCFDYYNLCLCSSLPIVVFFTSNLILYLVLCFYRFIFYYIERFSIMDTRTGRALIWSRNYSWSMEKSIRTDNNYNFARRKGKIVRSFEKLIIENIYTISSCLSSARANGATTKLQIIRFENKETNKLWKAIVSFLPSIFVNTTGNNE